MQKKKLLFSLQQEKFARDILKNKIPFTKVFQSSKAGGKIDFLIEEEGVKCSGELFCDESFPDFVRLKGKLQGKITLICDLSGEEFVKTLDEDLAFYLSDGFITLDNEHFDDVFECSGGIIDLAAILKSELEMIRCDYHIKEEN